MGEVDTLYAKLWGVYHDAKLARELGPSSILMEIYSTDVVNLLTNGRFDLHPLASLILQFKILLNYFFPFAVTHMPCIMGAAHIPHGI